MYDTTRMLLKIPIKTKERFEHTVHIHRQVNQEIRVADTTTRN